MPIPNVKHDSPFCSVVDLGLYKGNYGPQTQMSTTSLIKNCQKCNQAWTTNNCEKKKVHGPNILLPICTQKSKQTSPHS